MSNLDDKYRLIEGSNFFKGFDARILKKIVSSLEDSSFQEGNIICLRGDPSDYFYIIVEGEADISVSSKDGKIIILGRLTKGDVFGEIGLLDRGPRTATVIAKSDISLYRLNQEKFSYIAADFGLKEWVAITNYICSLFRQVSDQLEGSAFLDTNVRILKTIIDLYPESLGSAGAAKPFELNMSQESLGNSVGLSREATNKVLSRLENMGLVEKKYKKIFIPDMRRLQDFLDQEKN